MVGQKSSKAQSVFFHVFSCALGFIMIYPLLWLLMSSFKSNDTMFHNAFSLIPEKWDIIQNYASGFKGIAGISFWTFFKNSAIVTASIFAFYWIWQDFFQPLIFVSNPKNFTIPLALKLYTDPNSYNNYGGLFAMSVISLLPVILIFIKFQKYLVEGIATDGIKG